MIYIGIFRNMLNIFEIYEQSGWQVSGGLYNNKGADVKHNSKSRSSPKSL